MSKKEFDSNAARAYFLSKEAGLIVSTNRIRMGLDDKIYATISFYDISSPLYNHPNDKSYNPTSCQLELDSAHKFVQGTASFTHDYPAFGVYDFLKSCFPTKKYRTSDTLSQQDTRAYPYLGVPSYEGGVFAASLCSSLTDESHVDLFYNTLLDLRTLFSNSRTKQLLDEYSSENKQLQSNIGELKARQVLITNNLHTHLQDLMDKNTQAVTL